MLLFCLSLLVLAEDSSLDADFKAKARPELKEEGLTAVVHSSQVLNTEPTWPSESTEPLRAPALLSHLPFSLTRSL